MLTNSLNRLFKVSARNLVAVNKGNFVNWRKIFGMRGDNEQQ